MGCGSAIQGGFSKNFDDSGDNWVLSEKPDHLWITSVTTEVIAFMRRFGLPRDGATRTATWGPHDISLRDSYGGHSGVNTQVVHTCLQLIISETMYLIVINLIIVINKVCC